LCFLCLLSFSSLSLSLCLCFSLCFLQRKCVRQHRPRKWVCVAICNAKHTCACACAPSPSWRPAPCRRPSLPPSQPWRRSPPCASPTAHARTHGQRTLTHHGKPCAALHAPRPPCPCAPGFRCASAPRTRSSAVRGMGGRGSVSA
jgi:hypothetical protein